MSTTITVTSAVELNQALSQATGGETILLAAGDYGTLNLSGTQFKANVTIKSADPNAMASFSGMYLKQTSNITFENIEFDYTYQNGQTEFAKPFVIENSSNVIISGSVFDGDVASGTGTAADGLGTGKGLVVKGSDNVDIVNTEFYNWWNALTVNTSTNVDIVGNNIHSIRSDGIKLGSSDSVLIEQNYIHDFKGDDSLSDHRDMIQIQRSSGTGVNDLTIRDNVFDMGAGDWTQTIWAGHDRADATDPTNWHTNLVIENNVIYNAHTHGISINLTDGLTIQNNTLLAVDRAQTGGITIPKILVSSNSKNVAIEQNVAPTVGGYNGQTDWSVTDNVYVQNIDPSKPDYYDSHFVYHAIAASDGYNQYGVQSGSSIVQLDAGSSLVDSFPMSYEAWAGIATTPTSSGSTSTGATTIPSTGGTAPVTTPDDTSGTSDNGTDISSPASGDTASQNQMVFDDFVLDIASLPQDGSAKFIGDVSVVDTASGPVLQFDGDRDMVKLGRLQEFENSEQLAFTVEYTRAEADGSEQRLVWNKGHVGLTLSGDGLIVHVGNNDDKFGKGFRVDNIGLNDTDAHRITVLVDQEADKLQVLVDGNLVLEETNIDFDFVGGREYGWNLGFKWNRNVDGEISDFAIDDEVAFIDTYTVDHYDTIA
ncbi:right-handed parallel beta-helix repeat-containing protein [Ruegeria sp. HKCCD7318]|uniref:right-handed parallel beta-helix repeat-containing protein n=1 Tax=Ruegeria sp. HKCCD7318 TaxID=2683014 RepID=UPI001491AE61|nr:right-handed parallel beta-helix repeat-containing protein [Ruegeria sp. HKCCD7318]NOE35820.1 hypothetical protein [Ruegeria sp. HKCCD7318]